MSRQSTENLLKTVLLTLTSILFISLLSLGGLQLSSTPEFCITCHEMKPEYVTWQASAHGKVNCIKCHIEPGVTNVIKHKISAMKQLYYHFNKSYYLPIEMPEPIPNQTCLGCHSLNRGISPSGDIKVPHLTHYNKGVLCVECHAGVVHGKIAERQATLDGDFDHWTVTVGKDQVTKDFANPPMSACIECHKARKAPTTCQTCHSQIVPPLTHQVAAWSTKHGLSARKDVQACDRCHSVTNGPKAPEYLQTGDKAIAYARSNTLCFNCHMKRPKGHGPDWKAQHNQFAQQNKEGCLVCHSYSKSTASGNLTKTYCQSCHISQHRNFNRASHPIQLPPGTKLNAACQRCHSSEMCGRCHSNVDNKSGQPINGNQSTALNQTVNLNNKSEVDNNPGFNLVEGGNDIGQVQQ